MPLTRLWGKLKVKEKGEYARGVGAEGLEVLKQVGSMRGEDVAESGASFFAGEK